MDRCFACGRPLKGGTSLADTHEDQFVRVGSDCYARILAAGEEGYQPPMGGPRLYTLTDERLSYFKAKGSDI